MPTIYLEDVKASLHVQRDGLQVLLQDMQVHLPRRIEPLPDYQEQALRALNSYNSLP